MMRTLVARVAFVQTLVTLAALGLVVAATWTAVNLMLEREAARALNDLLGRTMDYLEAGPAGEQIDWQWLAGEIDESRPRDVRFEVRDQSHARAVIQLGPGAVLGRFERGCHQRNGRRVCGRAGRRYVALAARDLAPDRALGHHLILALSFACALVGALVGVASVSVTRRAIRPLSDLALRVAAVVPGSNARLQPQATLRELEMLEQRFADLIDRFEQALLREKQFTAHASHELRTPLTLARAEVEALPDSQAALDALARLESLIQALLWFGRAQPPLHGEDMELVNLADVLADLTGEHSCKLVAQLPDEALVRGDERLLSSATSNLLDNAVKHGAGSEITIALVRERDEVVLRVTNGGPEIDPKLREDIFVPFVRGRSTADGFGLGLPFARAVARAHGGDLVLQQSDASHATTLVMRLPLIAWHEELAGLDSV